MEKTELHLHLLGLIGKLGKTTGWHRLKPNGLFPVLEASDRILLNAYQVASGEPIKDFDTEGGKIELGSFLYYMNHPPHDLEELSRLVVDAMELAEGSKLPASQFSPESFEAMLKLADARGVVGPGGEIYGDGKYEQLDAGWIFSLFMFVIYELGLAKHHSFGDTPNIIDVPTNQPVRIAIVGDWGTGKFGKDDGPAVAVMKGIQTLSPDYIVHLGDVYYAGIGSEETHNLLDLWPESLGTDRSFTLNSNHEMYDGANGYFDNALQARGPFSAQQQTSYFAIRYGQWLFLGLDSAFFSSPEKLFMDGNIDGTDGAQASWIKNNFENQNPDKVVVLTHHTPVDISGDELTDADDPDSLWSEVVTALGNRVPGTWYFGHTHNAAVYSASSAIGKTGCKGRLVGHGAIPYGKSVKLKQASADGFVEYFPQTRLEPGSVRVKNGFAMLEIDASGNLTETFYEVADGSSKAHQVWPI